MTMRARGQALMETAIFLPIALLTLFAVIWAAQYGVMSERVQSAVRYSGLVSNELNPYQEYSFYVLYNSLGAASSNAPIPAQTCNAPNTGSLDAGGSNATTGSPFPGQTSGPFWEATAAPATTTCLNTNSLVAKFNGGGMNQVALALSNTPIVRTSMLVPPYLMSAMTFGNVLGSSTFPANASLNFIKPADLPTLMTCHSAMQTTVGLSLAPPLSTPLPITTPSAIPEPMPLPSPILLTPC
jgi:hypothetical protein